jgi:hypothetical protein
VMEDLRATPPRRAVRPAWMHDRVRAEVAAALLATARLLQRNETVGLQVNASALCCRSSSHPG